MSIGSLSRLTVFSLILLQIIPVAGASIRAPQQTGETVYAAAADSVFLLEVFDSAGKQTGTATGFLVSENQILTNAHVVDAGTIQVRLGALRVHCEVQRIDHLNDLALCGMSATSSAPVIKPASTDPRPGARVFALGNPKGLEKTITDGLFTGYRDREGRRVAQISAAISPGSSGGPVLNSEGELLGVVVSTLADGQALNFAVPLSVVRDFLAGKAPIVNVASLIHTAKTLSLARDKLQYADSRWKELDGQVGDALTRAVELTSDAAVLSEVQEIATWFHIDIQVLAARKALQITKVPTSTMYSNLAQSLYYSTDVLGTSTVLDEAEQAAARAVVLSRAADDLMLLGDIQRQAEKFREAYRNYLAASIGVNAATVHAATAQMGLFRVSQQLGRDGEAENWFKEADKLARRPALEWSEYAQFLATRSRYADAASAYMVASQQAPAVYRYICNASVNYYSANAYDEALPAARRCLELATTEKDASSEIGRAHRIVSYMLNNRGVYDEAAAHAREALAVDPSDEWAHYALSRALNRQRRFTEALSAGKNAIRLSDGKYAVMHFQLGSAHFEMKQWPEAAEAFKKSAEIDANDSNAAYNVAASLYNDESYSEALSWYREALRRNPNHADREDIRRTIERLSSR